MATVTEGDRGEGASGTESEAIATTARRGWSTLALALAVALWILALVLSLPSEFRAGIGPQDEGLLLAYPALMLHGAVPNATFLSTYGAGSYWPIAGAFAAFGPSVMVERGVAFVYWLVLSGSIFALVARRRGPLTGAVAAIACVVLLAGPITLVAYAWIGAVALGALGLWFLDLAVHGPRNERRWLPASGLAFGLVVSCRSDLAVAVGLVIAMLFFVDRRRLWPVLSGLAVGLVPLLVNVAQAGPYRVLRGQVIWPTVTTRPGRTLPLSWSGTAGELALALSVVVTVGLIWFGVAAVRRGESFVPLAVGLFDAGLLPQGFQRADAIHVAYVACFVIPSALLVPLPRRARTRGPRLAHYVWPAAAIVLVALVAPLGWSPYRDQVARSLGFDADPQYTISNEGRSLNLSSPQQVQDLGQLLAVLDRRARPGARVFVGPQDLRRTNLTDTYIYFLLPNLTPGSFYLEMEPGVANAASSGLSQQISGDDWLILTSEWDDWVEPNASVDYGSDGPNRVVRSQFSTVGTWGSWELLRRDRSR